MRNNIVEQVKNYAKLNNQSSFCLIAKYLITNIQEIEKKTITTISEKTNTSPATITRFCQTLGFTGFKNFKFFMIWERDDFLVWNKFQTKTPDISTFLTAVEKNVGDYYNEMEKFVIAANLITKYQKVYLYGFGGNSHLIKIFQNYLVRLNINAIFLHDRDDQVAYSQLTNEKSLNVIISYKFRDSRWAKIFQNIRLNHAPCILISKKLPENEFVHKNDLIINFRFSEGFEFYRDNSEISMLMILLLIIERIIVLNHKATLLKNQDVW